MERPIGFPEALRVLRSWEGKRVWVTISNQQGRELTSVVGNLLDHSTADHIESAWTIQAAQRRRFAGARLEEPNSCALGDGSVRITTAGEMIVLFAYAAEGNASDA